MVGLVDIVSEGWNDRVVKGGREGYNLGKNQGVGQRKLEQVADVLEVVVSDWVYSLTTLAS